MSTIPASQIVNVLPSVLNAGGNALNLIGLVLTPSTRVPIGAVQPFPSQTAVSAYFGPSSKEYAESVVYFNGYTNSTQKPGSILFTQYNSTAVPAYLRSSNITTLGLAAIQALTGTLIVVVDGYTHSASSFSLSAATSYSAAAALIQTALTATEPTEATVTGSIAATTFSVTGAINGFILTVTAVTSGTIVEGAIITGTGVVTGSAIGAQISGTTGGIGTYFVSSSTSQIVASETISGTYGTLTVTAVSTGTLSIGQTITGVGVTAGTLLTALGTGTGLTGTYFVSPSQTVSSEALTATASPLTVTFDSVSNAFVITSGISGAESSVAFATGTLAIPLLMTAATGAILSQGAEAATPSAFMNALTANTTNWATFMLDFDPDFGSGNTQKLAFSAWNSGVTDDNYVFVCWDSDITPTISVPAQQSLGYLIGSSGNNYSGTCLVYDPTDTVHLAAFICGYVASINFNTINGRTTAAFRSQSGLAATVSNQTIAQNLIANGYNFYGVYATASQNFTFLYPGSISGPFQWLDSYANQIWLNNGFQQALMNLLTIVSAIPYTASGYAMIPAACQTQINQGLSFGAFRAGVPLSSTQIIQVNNQAGAKIDNILNAQGWYFQVQPATPQVRQARQTPPCFFWYTDGQSVQMITLNSIDVQ
jgi:hypothetical protein